MTIGDSSVAQSRRVKTERRLFSGVLVPVLTPFDDRLAPDPGRYLDLCQRLLHQGADGLAVFGTTSEGNSLSSEERKQLIKQLVAAGIPGEKLMPGIGTCSVTETADLLRSVADVGVAGVLMLPPFYYKHPLVDDDGLFDFVVEVMRRTEGIATKIYLYHIPPVANVGWSIDLVGRLIREFPDRIVGLKDSSGDWENTKTLIETYRGFDVFPGSEVFLLDGLRLGGAGCITATGNLNPAGIRSVVDAVNSGLADDHADALQEQATRIRVAIQQAGPPIPVMKAYLALKTGDPAWSTVRPPLRPKSPSIAESLDRELRELGFEFDLFDSA